VQRRDDPQPHRGAQVGGELVDAGAEDRLVTPAAIPIVTFSSDAPQGPAQLRCSAGWQRWQECRAKVGLRRYSVLI
ncbi:MAG: hypothetical protein LC790_04860, partial [Actinobacteria bacterium]|nr:hypothetical protein [Actinomycetota bacterium]